jgi:hypothetical protein
MRYSYKVRIRWARSPVVFPYDTARRDTQAILRDGHLVSVFRKTSRANSFGVMYSSLHSGFGSSIVESWPLPDRQSSKPWNTREHYIKSAWGQFWKGTEPESKRPENADRSLICLGSG